MLLIGGNGKIKIWSQQQFIDGVAGTWLFKISDAIILIKVCSHLGFVQILLFLNFDINYSIIRGVQTL